MTANTAADNLPSRRLGQQLQQPPARRRRVPIRLKLAAAMCIPTVALTLFVAGEVMSLSREVAQVERQTSLATSTHGPTQVVIAIQTERNWAVVELLGQSDTINVGARGYPDTRQRTDEALADFQEKLARGEDEAVEAYAPAIEGLEALTNLRQKIDNFTEPRGIDNVPFANDIFYRYSLLIAPFLEGTSQVADIVDHPELRQAASLIDMSVRQMEIVAQLGRQTIVYGVLSRGGVDQTFEIAELGVLLDQYVSTAAILDAETQGEYRRPVDDWMFKDWTTELSGHVDGAIHTGVLNLGEFLEALTVEEDRTYVAYEAHVADVLQEKADDLTGAASRKQLLYMGAVLLVGLVAVAGMIVVGQMIVRSLKSLTRQATDMAHRRLPSAVATVLSTPPGDDVAVPPVEPVRLETSDEVGDVASALNTVQSAAIDLAVGQAVLRRNIADSFVNLGRRNQNLLSRQIAFITELEHRETDPDNLANLFRLDHLATRMRRNAESLLVLGGVPTTRSHSGPMRITDIVRATLSEVEDYQRVVIRTLQPALVNGSTGADLIHLLAELVDNALMFSHRDRTAEIQGLAHPAGYTLTITDQGMGMRADDIARANRRLAGTEQFTVAPSRYLGHYVAGHLAARHGIRVRLQEAAPTGGIAATVHVPHTALASAADPDGAGNGRGGAKVGSEGRPGQDASAGGPAPISGGWLQEAPAPTPGPAGPIVHTPLGATRPTNPPPRTTSDHPPHGSLPAAPAP